MNRFVTSPWGALFGLLLFQWIWAVKQHLHVVKSATLSDQTIRVEARKAVSWGHFVPGLGAILLINPDNHNVIIDGYGQREVINVDMVGDFPWKGLHVQEQADTVSVVDDEGTAYATFQK